MIRHAAHLMYQAAFEAPALVRLTRGRGAWQLDAYRGLARRQGI